MQECLCFWVFWYFKIYIYSLLIYIGNLGDQYGKHTISSIRPKSVSKKSSQLETPSNNRFRRGNQLGNMFFSTKIELFKNLYNRENKDRPKLTIIILIGKKSKAGARGKFWPKNPRSPRARALKKYRQISTFFDQKF